jgi:hypothetical protein
MQPVLSASTPDELALGLDLLSRSDFVFVLATVTDI